MKTKTKILQILFTGILLLPCVPALAQKATVRITVQPSEILIGEQAVIDLEVIAPKGRNIQFPIYGDTIVTGLEVLGMLPTDTTMTEVMKLNQRYVVTSFDSTLYHIPFMPILDGTDTIRSNDIGLKVTSPQLSDSTLAYLEKLKNQETDSIDFAKLEIKEPYTADVADPPFIWQDYLQYLLYAAIAFFVFVLLVLALVVYLNKKRKGYYFTPKIIEPPHVIALRELEELRRKQLSQKGMEKEYYTQMTDILREYIYRRYHINATEMITADILEAVHRITDTRSASDNLAQILTLADLVKFAKYVPPTNENDLSLVNAMLFVNQTKLEEKVEAVDADGKPQATQVPDVLDSVPPPAPTDAGSVKNNTKNEANS